MIPEPPFRCLFNRLSPRTSGHPAPGMQNPFQLTPPPDLCFGRGRGLQSGQRATRRSIRPNNARAVDGGRIPVIDGGDK